jgi:hypothetical protein
VANAGVVLWGRTVVRDTVRTEVRSALKEIFPGLVEDEKPRRTWSVVPSAMASTSE